MTTDTTPAAIEALMKAYPTPRSPFSRDPLLEVVYADPGSNGLYYRGKKPDSFAAFVRVDLFAAELATARAERDGWKRRHDHMADGWKSSDEEYEAELATLRKEVERLQSDRPFIIGANHGYETAMDQLRETLQEQNAALVEAKREMWVGARSQWTLADFKNWYVIQQIDAALAKGRAALTAEPLCHGVTADDFGGEA